MQLAKYAKRTVSRQLHYFYSLRSVMAIASCRLARCPLHAEAHYRRLTVRNTEML